MNRKLRSFFLNFALLTLAAFMGWWVHGANRIVLAESASHQNESLSFQFGGTEVKGSLTIYNSSNHTLYVYPAAEGNSHINCAYSLHIDKPGAPIERQNCQIGSIAP